MDIPFTPGASQFNRRVNGLHRLCLPNEQKPSPPQGQSEVVNGSIGLWPSVSLIETARRRRDGRTGIFRVGREARALALAAGGSTKGWMGMQSARQEGCGNPAQRPLQLPLTATQSLSH